MLLSLASRYPCFPDRCVSAYLVSLMSGTSGTINSKPPGAITLLSTVASPRVTSALKADFGRLLVQNATYQPFGKNRPVNRKYVFARSTRIGHREPVQ